MYGSFQQLTHLKLKHLYFSPTSENDVSLPLKISHISFQLPLEAFMFCSYPAHKVLQAEIYADFMVLFQYDAVS